MKGEKFPLILFLEELVKNQYELFTVKYLDCYSANDHHASDTHAHTLLFMPCVPSHPLATYQKREGGPEVTSRRSAGRIRWGGGGEGGRRSPRASPWPPARCDAWIDVFAPGLRSLLLSILDERSKPTVLVNTRYLSLRCRSKLKLTLKPYVVINEPHVHC